MIPKSVRNRYPFVSALQGLLTHYRDREENREILDEVDIEDILQRQGSYSQDCRYIESWLEVRLYPYKFQQPKARDEQWTQRRGETGSFDSSGSWHN